MIEILCRQERVEVVMAPWEKTFIVYWDTLQLLCGQTNHGLKSAVSIQMMGIAMFSNSPENVVFWELQRIKMHETLMYDQKYKKEIVSISHAQRSRWWPRDSQTLRIKWKMISIL